MAKFKPVKLAHNEYEPNEGSDSNLSPIIFLHGFSVIKEMWEDIPQRLADLTKRKTYSYDARNHGESEFTDDFSYESTIQDLFHFMDTLDIQKAVLVGHNSGGHTAIHAALEKPERVEKLVIEDMYIDNIPKQMLEFAIPAFELRKESLEHIPKGMSHEDAVKFSADYMLDKLPPDNILHQIVKKDNMYKLKVLLKQQPNGEYSLVFNYDTLLKAMKEYTCLTREARGEYNGPAFFLYSKESPLQVKSHEDHIKKHFPNAEMIGFDGQIHVIHLDLKEEFIETVSNCLQK